MLSFARTVSVLVVVAVVIFSVSAFAGDEPADLDPIEQLMNVEVTTVTGASKYQQEATDAPASVSIVTSDDIRKGGYRTLAEVLNSVRGFYTTYNRTYNFVGLRGFTPLGDFGTRLLLLVDGFRLNDAVYEQAPVGSDFPVDIDLIDRIEVIRGPASSLYGTNAFQGVINVITRSAMDIKGVELSSSGGSFNSWVGRASGGSKLPGGVNLLFSGSFRDSAGNQRIFFPEYAATNNGIAQGADGEKSWDLLMKGRLGNLSLLFLHQSRDKNDPTASFEAIFGDPGEKISDRHTLTGLNYSENTQWVTLNARLTYNRYEYDGDYPQDNAGLRRLNRDVTIAEWIGSDLYASKTFGDHLVTLGMEHRWQFNMQQQNFTDTPTKNMLLDDNHKNLIQGYYLQDEYHIQNNLIMNAGLRFDYYDNFGGTTSPRAALIWKPQNSTVLRLSYGEAFRAPNGYEHYYGDNIYQKGNLDLKPEKIRTLELGWDQFIGNNLKITATGYYSRIENLIRQSVDTSDDMLVFKNQNRYETKGVELEAQGKWENGFSGRLSYSYQECRVKGDSRSPANSPGTLVKASLTAPLQRNKSFATLETIYGSSRLNADSEKITSAAIVNLTLLNRNLLQGLDLSASIYNLFDTRQVMPASSDQTNSLGETLRGIPLDGITFRIKATYRF